ncbi:MAG: DUF6497 family protein [Marinosulfonomonas sp.]
MAVSVVQGAAAQAAPMDVPSGLELRYFETISDHSQQGLSYRFRFIAPAIAREFGEVDFETLEKDMAFLCNSFALPRIPNMGPKPSQIVISIADRETKFGFPDPEATQIFEAYSIDGDTCIWEPF